MDGVPPVSTASAQHDQQQQLVSAEQALAIDDSLDDYNQWDQAYWQDRAPEAMDTTIDAAQVWSRIIRTPRKRGKHIIVDICSPEQDPTTESGVDTSQGHLVRQIIATTDKRTWLGPAGYRLARKSRWGDLWPKFYQDYALTQKS